MVCYNNPGEFGGGIAPAAVGVAGSACRVAKGRAGYRRPRRMTELAAGPIRLIVNVPAARDTGSVRSAIGMQSAPGLKWTRPLLPATRLPARRTSRNDRRRSHLRVDLTPGRHAIAGKV